MDTQEKSGNTAGHQAPEGRTGKNAGARACIRCGQNSAYRFRALEVRTLHIRDMDREKRVQALGDFVDFAVCRDCAGQKLGQLLKWQSAVMRRCLPFGLVLLMGIILTAVFLPKDRILMMTGIAAVICGVLGVWSSVSEGTGKIREYKAKSEEKAMYDAAWETVIGQAPRKEGEDDLTYIPINEETLSRKNGDLMLLYHLLPEISVQAYQRIHAE